MPGDLPQTNCRPSAALKYLKPEFATTFTRVALKPPGERPIHAHFPQQAAGNALVSCGSKRESFLMLCACAGIDVSLTENFHHCEQLEFQVR